MEEATKTTTTMSGVGLPSFPVNARVILHGLSKSPNLNGKLGVVVTALNQEGRQGVKIDGEKETVAVNPSNLRLHDDYDRFPKAPDQPTCPICFLTLPFDECCFFNTCCGKIVCTGCMYQIARVNNSCAYCREPLDREGRQTVPRLKNLIERSKNPMAFYSMALIYLDGEFVDKDPRKEIEMLHISADLACPEAAFKLAVYYRVGYPQGGIEANQSKLIEYLEIAAYKGGYPRAWHQLGLHYDTEGDFHSAVYHFRMAAAYGDEAALGRVVQGFYYGNINREDHDATLKAYCKARDDIDSDDRRKAKELMEANGQKKK